jgi:hypothetical protein
METSVSMRNILSYTVAAGLVCALTSTLTAVQPSKPPGPGNKGTDILHWAVRESMINENTNSTATAKLDLKQNQQGNADNQRLNLTVAGLETNTTYQIWAAIEDDTNFVHVSDFSTDASGNSDVRLMKVGSSKGKGLAKGHQGLPSSVDPISHIRELAIGNVNTQFVFSANLTAPDKLQYLVKRRLENQDGAVADLRIKATNSKLSFKLNAWGLTATNQYFLALNNAIVSSGDSSAGGTLSFLSIPVNAADILTIREVAIWNSASNTVISTHLP